MEMKLLKFLNLVSIPVLFYFIIIGPVLDTPVFWIIAFMIGLITAIYNVVNEP